MLHKALRLMRQYHQYSPSQLASILDITKERLVEIESNHHPVTPELLNKYSKEFDIPVSSLMLFSESIGKEGRFSKRVRISLAGKALLVLEWMTGRNDAQTKIEA